jgi:outer membrane protein assembly factor BamB
VLAAIDLATGNVAWETNLAGEHWVMSDPILTQGTLYAISARHTEWGYTLLLLSIDLQTGVVLRERPLVGLRESWWQLGDCQVWAADERLFIAGGGAVIRCDLMGDVAWVRQQPLVPREVDPFWCMQAQLPPLLHGEKLFVVQLGVPGVAALDAKNGRLLWRANFTTARRVLGVIHDRLLVETAHGVRALDVATGNRIWQFPSSNLLDGYLVGQQGGVVLSERVAVPEQSVFQVRLTWLDVTTGEVQNQSTLDFPPHAQIFFGPTWFANNRWWAFAGQVLQDPNRNLIELVPK